MRRILPLTAIACTVLLTACAATPGNADPSSARADGHVDDDFAWGEPASADAADRIVEVEMLDTLEFSPASIAVSVGETVTFRVTNTGDLPHDFTLGDSHTQAAHEAEMAEGMSEDAHAEPNVLSLDAGETGELTWRFTAPDTIQYGCHVPGHYDAGMVGTLTIES